MKRLRELIEDEIDDLKRGTAVLVGARNLEIPAALEFQAGETAALERVVELMDVTDKELEGI